MPMAASDVGSGSAFTSHEKHAYHAPQICLRISVPIFSGNARCNLILTLPTFDNLTWLPSTLNVDGVNTSELKRLRPLNRGKPGISPSLTRRKKFWNERLRRINTACNVCA